VLSCDTRHVLRRACVAVSGLAGGNDDRMME